MSRELVLYRSRQGETRITVERSTVILCEDAAHATRTARAFGEAGVRVIDGGSSVRGRVGDHVDRQANPGRVASLIAELHLPEDVHEWRPRELPVLQQLLAASLLALVDGVSTMVFDVTHVAASPFDVAHLFAHLARVRTETQAEVIAIISDPAFISSAGSHLVVLGAQAVLEQGPVAELLATPSSAELLRRLQATPIAHPLAMQARRVQRASTTPVNYAHTQVIAMPTQDSIALAGGDED